MPPKSKEQASCHICETMVLRRNLYRHTSDVHKYTQDEINRMKDDYRKESQSRASKLTVSCPACDDRFVDHEHIATHCYEKHYDEGANGVEQNYTVYSLTFQFKDEFEVFLHEQCEETISSLYQRASKGRSYSLRCNRSGLFQSVGTVRTRMSRKDVSHCSCFTNYTVDDDGTVLMKGCFGHIGHDVEPALLRLTEEQKQHLRRLLEDHSLDYVIRRVRNDFSPELSRLHFVTKGDLWNIIEKYGMRPGFRNNNDLTSLQMRADENNADDGIQLLEMAEDPSGKGFTLVIITPTQLNWLKQYSGRGISIDDTHGATRYSLKLATVVVADERDRGLPAAFLLSGTMTTNDVEKLFGQIRKLFPDFNPAQIITDEAPCFIKGFKAVFPGSKAVPRYCRLHISKTWERKVKELVEARVRDRVQNDLHELLRIGHLQQFQLKFGEVLALLDVEGQREMAQYLRTNYLGRIPSWASFAGRGAVMDTTMMSERWHLRLKNEILHRNANSRVDCSVELLIRAVEDLADSNDIKDRRRLATASFRTQQTLICHRSALTYYEGRPEKVRSIGRGKWEVQGKTSDKAYLVESLGRCGCNPGPGGNVHCPQCGVCPYTWTCTCLDNRAGVSCIHRHAVKISENAATTSSLDRDEEADSRTPAQEVEGNFQLAATDPIVHTQEQLELRKVLRNKIQMSYTILSANVNALVNTDTEEAMHKLNEIHELIETASKITVAVPTKELQITARPELSRPGGKPKLTKAKLFTRAEQRKKRDADKDDQK